MFRRGVETVESGSMTKDLALLISSDAPWLTTEQFLADLREKDAVILLRDTHTHEPRGFSTQVVSHLTG